ncbi:Hint domain-containing protein [Parasegetibacter sp. NRK P23]|uniref:Hint domain-containing protein n=1 Tax=Parasegetibacter sp. NRK P23 TaxID=2942999 RepID=UPI002044CC36|nr:Hint domain-containing protein [Parasegetibacter sp. NRK P23]MCM5529350.1 hypothetical protein [Parasegetibacter sp. NRK P23]
MKTKLLLVITIAFLSIHIQAQDTKPRAITADEYALAKTALVKDLDKDTYVKLSPKYVLDRYEMKKPYFITGDDGLRKRIDLYKLIARDSMQELGTILFYTTEKGKLYTACIPSLPSEGKVWERYFEDIHAIDKEEKNFVLKLSYVLSREFSFLLGRASGKGGPVEDANYGNEICFPGSGDVLMANGSYKKMSEVKEGDEVVTIHPHTLKASIHKVTDVAVHTPKNYAVTTLTLIKDEVLESAVGKEVRLSVKSLSATPNHPVSYGDISVEMGRIPVGAQLLCRNETGGWSRYQVVLKEEKAHGVQPVFSINTADGSALVVDGVLVLQKK